MRKKNKNTVLIQFRISPGLKMEVDRYSVRKAVFISTILRQYLMKITGYEEDDSDIFEDNSGEVKEIKELPIKGL
jgi:hypothetical protein